MVTSMHHFQGCPPWSGRPSSPLPYSTKWALCSISTEAWLEQSYDCLPGTPRYSPEAQFFSNPSQAHPLFTECLLAEAKPISVTLNQRELSQGLAMSSEHILKTTLTPKTQAYSWKKVLRIHRNLVSHQLLHRTNLLQHTPVFLTSCMFMTWQIHQTWHSRVFLDRSAVNRIGSVIWGTGHISKGSGNLGKGLQYMALSLCSLLLKFWSQESLTVPKLALAKVQGPGFYFSNFKSCQKEVLESLI